MVVTGGVGIGGKLFISDSVNIRRNVTLGNFFAGTDANLTLDSTSNLSALRFTRNTVWTGSYAVSNLGDTYFDTASGNYLFQNNNVNSAQFVKFYGNDGVYEFLAVNYNNTATTMMSMSPGVVSATSTLSNSSTVLINGGLAVTRNILVGGSISATLRSDATTSGTNHHVFYNPATRELTTATGTAGATVTISDTPPSSPTAGSLWFDSSVANLRIYYSDQDSSQWVDANGASGYVQTITESVVANDISSQFDGRKAVFALKQDQSLINTVVDSRDVEVVINGARLTPYVTELRYPWLTPYDSYRGFRVVGSNLIIYNAPFIGDSASVIVNPPSTTVQKRRYPFSATTIALGD